MKLVLNKKTLILSLVCHLVLSNSLFAAQKKLIAKQKNNINSVTAVNSANSSNPVTPTSSAGSTSSVTPLTQYKSKPFRLSDKGFIFHIGIVKPSSNFEIEQNRGGVKTQGDISMSQALGLRAGLSFLPVKELGWDMQLTRIFIDEHPTSKNGGKAKATVDGVQRLEGSLAFAFTEHFFTKAGINLSTVELSNTDAKLNSNFGFQLGAGFQLLDNLGLHMDYVSMTHQTDNKSTFNGRDVSTNLSTDLSGVEVGISAIF